MSAFMVGEAHAAKKGQWQHVSRPSVFSATMDGYLVKRICASSLSQHLKHTLVSLSIATFSIVGPGQAAIT